MMHYQLSSNKQQQFNSIDNTLRKRYVMNTKVKNQNNEQQSSEQQYYANNTNDIYKKCKITPSTTNAATTIHLKKENNTQLIYYKDNQLMKSSISIKNGKTITTKLNNKKLQPKKSIVKYKAISNFELDSKDANVSTFKLTTYERNKRKQDIISNTVDAWASSSRAVTSRTSSNMLSSFKNSLFGHTNRHSSGYYKPLVFGGTYPIDAPVSYFDENDDDLVVYNDIEDDNQKDIYFRRCFNQQHSETPRTFDIDAPID